MEAHSGSDGKRQVGREKGREGIQRGKGRVEGGRKMEYDILMLSHSTCANITTLCYSYIHP